MASVRVISSPTALWSCRTAFRAVPITLHRRSYHSYEHEEPPPFNDAENAILSAALSHVPTYGFTTTALSHGARDVGYLEVSTNLFPRGPFDLINYHLVSQRLALKDHVQFPNGKLGVGAKVRLLALHRLRANELIIHRWQEVIYSCRYLTSATRRRSSLRPLTLFLTFISRGAAKTALTRSFYAGPSYHGRPLEHRTLLSRTRPPLGRNLVPGWRY